MAAVTVTGLAPLITELRGPLTRDVNRELRGAAREIAAALVPVIADAVRASPAPQAAALAGTVRVHSDRLPIVVVGKTNPKLSGFTRRGSRADGRARVSVKLRRGALAHGVVYGPKGGRRDTPAAENYYRTGRDSGGGPVGASLAQNGAAFDAACRAYLDAYADILRRHGFIGASGRALRWSGR